MHEALILHGKLIREKQQRMHQAKIIIQVKACYNYNNKQIPPIPKQYHQHLTSTNRKSGEPQPKLHGKLLPCIAGSCTVLIALMMNVIWAFFCLPFILAFFKGCS
ncbi:hypothetical protein L6164_011684 [Bauhinia variegata]|uniref:Uncharacterized protein n=1 Tax=Bauhinia variegata TaxID=167791 RepID=A0ACB9P6Q4_BAUVA|nr:hypothetical protein L6164_011684 [Bauhinia variegata]